MRFGRQKGGQWNRDDKKEWKFYVLFKLSKTSTCIQDCIATWVLQNIVVEGSCVNKFLNPKFQSLNLAGCGLGQLRSYRSAWAMQPDGPVRPSSWLSPQPAKFWDWNSGFWIKNSFQGVFFCIQYIPRGFSLYLTLMAQFGQNYRRSLSPFLHSCIAPA